MGKPEVDPNKITAQDVDAVLQYLPYFADPSNKFYEADDTTFDEPTDIILEPFIYSKKVREFEMTLYHCNFIQEFNWPSWYDEAQKYQNNPDLIVDLETIIKLLTAHMRANRFCSGYLAEIIDGGHLLQILQRLSEIRKERFP